MAFDAMKGLKEALRDREERRSRVEKRELSDDEIERISAIIGKLESGTEATVEHYRAFHDVTTHGTVKAVDVVFKYIMLDDEKIFFDDIYDIKI